MMFNEGAEIYTSDGQKLGHMAQVILNPHTKMVTHIVVHKGHFFFSNKVIPVKDIQQTLADRVTLHPGAQTDAYPDYVETHFLPLVGNEEVAGKLASPVLWYPPLEMMVYNPMSYEDLYIVSETRNIPTDSKALAIGSKVITSDGKHAGQVQEVFMESTTQLASHILVSKGVLLPAEKLVPTLWIQEIEGSEIHLGVDGAMLMSVPDYNRRD